jgi:hypothetical protein
VEIAGEAVLRVVEVTEVVRRRGRKNVVNDGPKVVGEGEVLLERLANRVEESDRLGRTGRGTGGGYDGLVEENDEGKRRLAGGGSQQLGEFDVGREGNFVAIVVAVGEGGWSGVEGEALLDLPNEGFPGRRGGGSGNREETSFVVGSELEIDGRHCWEGGVSGRSEGKGRERRRPACAPHSKSSCAAKGGRGGGAAAALRVSTSIEVLSTTAGETVEGDGAERRRLSRKVRKERGRRCERKSTKGD